MVVTVGELLQMPVLKEAHVLVGAEGLNRLVKYIDVIEVPDIVDWAKPGTVYLTTAYPFVDNPELFAKTVQGFAEHGVSALMLKLGRFIEEIPPRVYQIANSQKLPIIILPTDMAYSPIITAVGQKLYESGEEQASYNDYHFQQKLHQLLTDGENAQALAGLLAEQLGGEVFVENAVGQLACSAGEERTVNIYHARKWLDHEAAYFRDMAYYEDHYYTVLLMPAYLGEELQGNIIVIFKEPVTVDEQLYGPLKRIASAVALELSREKAVYERRIRLEQALLENIIDNYVALDENAVSQQMSTLGWDHAAVQLIAMLHLERRDGVSDRQKLEQQVQKVSYRLSDWLKRQAFQGIFCRKGDKLVCLCALPRQTEQPAETLGAAFEQLLAELARDFGELLISVGMSRPATRVGELGNAYSDAQRAVRMGRRAYGGGSVYDYRQMGVYRLLFTHSDTDSLREFYEDYLAPLVQYDQKHGSDLVHTIEAYYQNNGNTLATAEQLYIHRNTLNYRLKRASETLGFDVDAVERKLCVSLALQIKTFLNL